MRMRSKELKHINNIYFLLILVFSGYGISFYRSDKAIVVYFLLTVLLYFLNGVKLTKKFKVILLIWSLYAFGNMIYYKVVSPGFYLRHMLYFMSGYLLISIYKNDFFYKYERYMVSFAIISLFFFSWQILNLSSLKTLMGIFNINVGNAQQGPPSLNIFIYNINHNDFSGLHARNTGFAWEPGPFSIFLNLAIYFNLLRNKMRIKGNKKFIILFITLLTTQSTTGLLTFFSVYLYLFYKTNKISLRKLIIGLLFLSAVIFVFIKVDFLYQKVINLYFSGDAYNVIQSASADPNNVHSFGRFAAFQIGWIDFKSFPFFGYGGASINSYINSSGITGTNMISGLATGIGMYGVFGIFFLFYMLKKSSEIIAGLYQMKAKYGFLIIFLISFFAFHAEIFVILWAPIMVFTRPIYKYSII